MHALAEAKANLATWVPGLPAISLRPPRFLIKTKQQDCGEIDEIHFNSVDAHYAFHYLPKELKVFAFGAELRLCRSQNLECSCSQYPY